ncbi:hypothetical protein GCM10009576_021800 [Streptomyces rhizosphaericus]|uniref:MacB-like periplasmic core domain-containing protein n=2 Tax=Streptomyces rhizosphaericus TaxID=114699 RepID=A0ABN1S5P5_9ACTN
MFRTALRTLRSHRLRFAMPTVAVVLGVAFVTGSLLYGDSVRAAVNRARSNSQPDASVSITADPAAPHRLDDTLLRRLRALPSAAAARGVVEGRSLLVGSDGTLVGDLNQAAGVNYVPDGGGKDVRYPLAEGRGPRGAAEIAVDRRTGRAGRVPGRRPGAHRRGRHGP